MRSGRTANLLLFLSTLLLALFGAELVLRVVLDPMDYLKPVLVDDPVLKHRIEPGSGGHDSWGFRNQAVPQSSPVIAIGDSQTYGLNAPASKAWPKQLAAVSGSPVYSLSLGGYGPLQYLHLLKEKAILLKPKTVLVGLYLGNDLLDAYRLAGHSDHWARFRSQDGIRYEEVNLRKPSKFLGGIRDYLARSSLLYRIVTSSSLADGFRDREAASQQDEQLRFDNGISSTWLSIEGRLAVLDTDIREVSDGLRITRQALLEIQQYTEAKGIRLVVVLIPTKEQVLRVQLEKQPGYLQRQGLEKLHQMETRVVENLERFMDQQGIASINTLHPLSEAAKTHQLYPGNSDGHPLSEGYRVIAEHIHQHAMFRAAAGIK